MFETLVAHIGKLTLTKSCVIVAISGFGGAGKSTLADRLRDHFQVQESQVVRIDNLYRENPRGPGIFDQIEWPLLETIIQSAYSGGRLSYQGRDSMARPVIVEADLPPVLIIEGVRLLHPSLKPYLDVSVWMDCPQEIAMARAKERDRLQGDSEEVIGEWDTLWGPKDKAYFESFRPDLMADFLFSEELTDGLESKFDL